MRQLSLFDIPESAPLTLADTLIAGRKVSARFRTHLEAFLDEAYGIRKSSLIPDLRCFVNAQSNTYSQEINNICGSIQLAPGRVRGKCEKKRTAMEVPAGINTLNLKESELFYDSLAFTDVLTNSRVTPEEALNRQFSTLAQFPVQPQKIWLASYDRLIDEKHVAGNRIKERWTVEDGWAAVDATVAAAAYIASQRQRIDGLNLILACQGVDANQYRKCVERVLEFATPADTIGLGGWCILGREKQYMPTFWAAMRQSLPLIAEVTRKIHIFGVTWYRQSGQYAPPLPGLLKLCDRYEIELSTDGRSPISNALWKDWKGAGASFPYWRHNLAWVKAKLATLRDSTEYQSFY